MTDKSSLQYRSDLQASALTSTLPASPAGGGGGSSGGPLFATQLTITQPAGSSGSPYALNIFGGAHSGLTAGVEVLDIKVALDRTVSFAAGAMALQRAILISPPHYAFDGASVISQAAAVHISGAPDAGANATITDSTALLLGTSTYPFSIPAGRNLKAWLDTTGTGDYLNAIFLVNQADANANSIQGIEAYPLASNASGTVANMYGVIGNAEVAGAGAVTNIFNFRASVIMRGAGNLANAYYYHAQTPAIIGAPGTITNLYGFYMGVLSGGHVTNPWGVYIADTTAANFFGGSVKIGGAFGANGATPQTALASGGAAPAGGTGATAGAYDTAAHRDALITLVNNIRTALVANGIMS